MANDVIFKDFSVEVSAAMEEAAKAWLHEAGGELRSRIQRKTRVDTSGTSNSWDYKVDNTKLEAAVGSTSKNAIWEEFGTGEWALNGDGRKTPWYVPVEGYLGKKKPTYNGKVVIVIGKNGTMFYKTNGKKPSKAFQLSYDSLKDGMIESAQNKFKRLET